MGCDIHSYAEVRNKETGKWEQAFNFVTLNDFDKNYLNREKGDYPFDWRAYGMYGFLAGVRNYSCMVYLTDGECYCNVKPRGKMLWVISSRSEMNENLPGPKIKLN